MRDYIECWLRHNVLERALLEMFHAHVLRATRRYPAPYFPECDKGPDGQRAMTDELFAICNAGILARNPYRHRPPFVTYVQDDYNDLRILAHVFYKRPICLLWDLQKQTYAVNVRCYPDLRWKAELFRAVKCILSEEAEPVRGTSPVLWRLPNGSLRRLCSLPQAVDALRRAQLDGPRQAVRGLLDACGALSQKQLVEAVNELFPAPCTIELGPEQERYMPHEATSPDLLAELHRVYQALDDEEKSFIYAVIMGLSYEEMVQRFPEWCTCKKKAFLIASRVTEKFLDPLSARLDQATLSPRQILDLVLALLLGTPGGEA